MLGYVVIFEPGSLQYYVDCRVPRPGNGPPHSPGRLAAQDTHRTVAFVELLKHTNEPLGLALEGRLSRA